MNGSRLPPPDVLMQGDRPLTAYTLPAKLPPRSGWYIFPIFLHLIFYQYCRCSSGGLQQEIRHAAFVILRLDGAAYPPVDSIALFYNSCSISIFGLSVSCPLPPLQGRVRVRVGLPLCHSDSGCTCLILSVCLLFSLDIVSLFKFKFHLEELLGVPFLIGHVSPCQRFV